MVYSHDEICLPPQCPSYPHITVCRCRQTQNRTVELEGFFRDHLFHNLHLTWQMRKMSPERQSNLLRIRQLVSGGICVTILVSWLKATLPPAPSLPRTWTRWMLSLWDRVKWCHINELNHNQSLEGAFHMPSLPPSPHQKVGSEIVHSAFLLRLHFFFYFRKM